MGGLAIVKTQFGNPWPGGLWGGRFLILGYFALIPVSMAVLVAKGKPKRVLVVLLLAAVVTFAAAANLNIPPSLYTKAPDPYATDGGRFYLAPEEEAFMLWFHGTGKALIDQRLALVPLEIWNPSASVTPGDLQSANPAYVGQFTYVVVPHSLSGRASLVMMSRFYSDGFLDGYYAP
jgi:hypothetical protein